MTNISLWIMLTDLQPQQQCAAIVTRLGRSARGMARRNTPHEILNGGFRNGVQVDPMSYTLAALQDRFAALDDEARLASMTETLAISVGPARRSTHSAPVTRPYASEPPLKVSSS